MGIYLYSNSNMNWTYCVVGIPKEDRIWTSEAAERWICSSCEVQQTVDFLAREEEWHRPRQHGPLVLKHWALTCSAHNFDWMKGAWLVLRSSCVEFIYVWNGTIQQWYFFQRINQFLFNYKQSLTSPKILSF